MTESWPLRDCFRHWTALPTRWHDNDVYGHINNTLYYAFFDTLVNRYLIEHCGLVIPDGPVIGLVVETKCRYRRPLAFPQTVQGGLAVSHIGRSSVRYEVGLFAEDDRTAAAAGHFIHVYVDQSERRPMPLPESLRTALERLATSDATDLRP
ncbi:acyl-CoA thioesterase [Marinivivus vitaminiproducens]|uniref:acyl-CoA thioesterase n=1 Tax=Marinivivus vitaminiproducens TaxID=3035935 RepID=UPI0027A2A4C5|nr:thioesterase family protein [Geminicoccaceae bacterium SCSIO 64248]